MAGPIAIGSGTTHEEGVVISNEVHAQSRSQHGNVEMFRESMEQIDGTGATYTRTGKDAGPLCLGEALQEFGHFVGVRGFELQQLRLQRGIEADLFFWIKIHGLHIHRTLHVHGAGAPVGRQENGFFDLVSNPGKVRKHHRMFGDLLEERKVVESLQGELPWAGDLRVSQF